MSTPPSIQALRRANPRARAGFADSVAATADAVHARITATGANVTAADAALTATGAGLAAGAGATRSGVRHAGGTAPAGGRSGSWRLVRASTAGALVAAAAVAVVMAVGLPGAGPGVANAAAAVRKAATVTAAAAERSGTAVVQITHDGRSGPAPRSAGTTATWPSPGSAVHGPARPGTSSWSSTAPSTPVAWRATAGSSSATRRTSTPTAARPRRSTSPPCARTPAARPYAGSPTP